VNPNRLGLAGAAVAILATGVAMLVGPCSSGAPAPDPRAPSPEALPEPRRVPTPRRHGAPPETDGPAERAAAPRAAAGEGESGASALAAHVRVRVTRDGRPEAGAVVWLQSMAADEPAPDVPDTRWSDATYFGVPRHLGLAERFDPESSVVAPENRGPAQGGTSRDGIAEISVTAGVAYAVVVKRVDGSLLVADAPVVHPADGETLDVDVSLRRAATVAGRCVDENGSPVAGAMVQAFAATAERAASAIVRSGADGSFSLTVDGGRSSVRVRVAAPRLLRMCDSEAALPPSLDDAMVDGAIPGGPSVDVRLRRAPSVVLELTSDVPFGHLQVEELAFDETANVWGRLGGPVYTRDAATAADPKHAFVALSRADAQRPLMLWTWGSPPELSGVDPRGLSRARVHLAHGRKLSVTGKGWRAGDRLRVVCFIGAAGAEFPGVWVENEVGDGVTWSRDDTPPCEVELRLVRASREIGPHLRVPAGSEDAAVRLDL
jgi:hypothetical protein